MGAYAAALFNQIDLFVRSFAFGVLPFVLYACISPRVPFAAKLAWISGLLVPLALFAAFGFYRSEYVLGPSAALAYLALAAMAVQWLRDRLSAAQISKPILFSTMAVLFVATPALALPARIATVTAAAGWELMFAAYSYCVDTSRRTRPTLSECLFFLLVNPVLVYDHRGTRSDDANLAPGLFRAAGGLVTMISERALYAALGTTAWLVPVELTQMRDFSGYVRFVTYHSAYAVTVYLAHSGRASLSIGFMRLAGFRISERYRYPLLATNPVDFWRRWNLYLGAWARRYVFTPLTLRLGSLLPGARRVALAGGVFGTFVFVGVVHDYGFFLMGSRVVPGAGVVAFAAYGAAAVAWLGVERGERRSKRTRGRPWPLRVLSWALLLHFMLVVLWATSPA
jgi:hypothetical protein